MAAFRDFVETLRFPPNPNQKLDRTLPRSLAGGDPEAGRDVFHNRRFPVLGLGIACVTCHAADPGPGTKNGLHSARALQLSQPFKAPHLRNLYQKAGFQNQPGATTVRGFGLAADGSFGSLFEFLSRPFFGDLATNAVDKANLSAYLQAFDTGTAPAVGYTRTIAPANADDGEVINDWRLLEVQSARGNIDLIVNGTIDGKVRGLLYRPSSNDYVADRTGLGPFIRAELLAKIAAGDTLSLMGVPPGSGVRMGIDRDLDGRLDGD
jgi:hypothetical protein